MYLLSRDETDRNDINKIGILINPSLSRVNEGKCLNSIFLFILNDFDSFILLYGTNKTKKELINPKCIFFSR